MREQTQLVGPLSQVAYLQVREADSPVENSHTIQSVVNHVLQAGYAYVHYLREALGVPFEKLDYTVATPLDAIDELKQM